MVRTFKFCLVYYIISLHKSHRIIRLLLHSALFSQMSFSDPMTPEQPVEKVEAMVQQVVYDSLRQKVGQTQY